MTDNDQAEAVVLGLGEPEKCDCESGHQFLTIDDSRAEYTYAMCKKCRGWVWRDFRLPIYTTGEWSQPL